MNWSIPRNSRKNEKENEGHHFVRDLFYLACHGCLSDRSASCFARFSRLTTAAFTENNTGIKSDKLEAIRDLTTVLATNVETTSQDLRAKLLTIALLIDPDYRPAFLSNLSLHRKELPEPLDSVKEPSQLASDLSGMTFALGREAKSTAAKELVGMLLDVSHSSDRANTNVRTARTKYFQINGKPHWYRYLKKNDLTLDPPRPPLQPLSEGDEVRELNNEAIPLWRTSARMGTVVFTDIGRQTDFVPSLVEATYRPIIDVREKGDRNLTFAASQKENNFVLPEIASFMEIRHDGWLKNGFVEFSIVEDYQTEDGFSISLACGILLESFFTGNEVSDDTICMGALNSDGSIQTVGGAVSRIKRAHEAGAAVVLLPAGNQYALSDLALLGKARVLSQVQVFSVESFEDAWEVARVNRPAHVELSIRKFAAIQDEFEERGVMNVLNQASVQTRLDAILKRTPNHASARVMIDVVRKNLPPTLSLNGSVEQLYQNHLRLAEVLSDLRNESHQLIKIVRELQYLGARVEPRTRRFAGALYQMSNACWKHLSDPNSNRIFAFRIDEIEGLGDKVIDEIITLSRDPELIEDLEY